MHYAVQLFDERFFRFVLLHTTKHGGGGGTELSEKLQEELEKFKDNYPGKEVHFRMQKGKLDQEVKEVVEEEKIALIVMGTGGQARHGEGVWGSRTTQVMEKVNCPVIVVPEGTSYTPPKQIIFATDFEVEHTRNLDFLLDIAEKFKSRITALHILPGSGAISDRAMNGLQQLHERGNKVASHFVRNDDVAEGIVEFVRDHRTDMLSVMKHSYSFMERLVHKSVSKELALHSDVPILVLHDT